MKTGIIKAVNHFGGKSRKRAAVLAMTGAVVAAGVGLAVPAGASSLTPKAVSAVGNIEHFQFVTTSGTATTQGVIAYGAFTTHGIDHINPSSGATATDLLTFPDGSFEITHTEKSTSTSVDSKTCFYSFLGKGTYKISDGTGRYSGISGGGTFTFSGLGFGPKTKGGACNQNANPVVYQQVIDGAGPVNLT
jgi:hypothetical protein